MIHYGHELPVGILKKPESKSAINMYGTQGHIDCAVREFGGEATLSVDSCDDSKDKIRQWGGHDNPRPVALWPTYGAGGSPGFDVR